MPSVVEELWELPLSALRGFDRLTYIDLGEDDPRFWLSIDESTGRHELGFTDHLHFHLERGQIDRRYLTEENWLTNQGEQAVAAYLQTFLVERYGFTPDAAATLSVSGEGGGDEPHFSVTLTAEADSAPTVSAFVRQLWNPFTAAMINVSDPGTFDHPYLFAHIGA